jgi:hypothetical protein
MITKINNWKRKSQIKKKTTNGNSKLLDKNAIKIYFPTQFFCFHLKKKLADRAILF